MDSMTLLERVAYAKTLWTMTFADHKLTLPEDAAAHARDEKAIKLWGDAARPNFPEDKKHA